MSDIDNLIRTSGEDCPPGSGSDGTPSRHPFLSWVTAPPVILALAALLGVGVPVLLAAVSGSLSIPHNDAWSYSRIAQGFGLHGDIRLFGWNRSALVGQFVVLGPLASSILVQQIFVAMLALLTLFASYDLLSSTVGRGRAAIGVLIIAIWPGFGLLATSFMSDIPAMAATVCSLALGRRALARGSIGFLVAAALVGFWGATIREQVLAAPVAVLFAAWVSARRTRAFRMSSLLGVGVVLGVAFLIFELWRRSLGADDPPAVTLTMKSLVTTADTAVTSFLFLALALSPVIFLVSRPWVWRRPAKLAGLTAVGILAIGFHHYQVAGFFPGNYLDRNGPYAVAAFGERVILSTTVWWALVAIACVAAVLLAGLLVERLRHLDPMHGGFLLIMVLGTLAQRLSGQFVFDRYLLVLVPSLLAVVLFAPQREGTRPVLRPLLAAVAGTVVVAVSLVLTASALAFDAARWHAAEQAVAAGSPASDVDAGFEWVGYHSPRGVVSGEQTDRAAISFWNSMFPENRSCVLVSAAPHEDPAWRLDRIVPYRQYVLVGSAKLWVYSTDCGR